MYEPQQPHMRTGRPSSIRSLVDDKAATQAALDLVSTDPDETDMDLVPELRTGNPQDVLKTIRYYGLFRPDPIALLLIQDEQRGAFPTCLAAHFALKGDVRQAKIWLGFAVAHCVGTVPKHLEPARLVGVQELADVAARMSQGSKSDEIPNANSFDWRHLFKQSVEAFRYFETLQHSPQVYNEIAARNVPGPEL